jgi:hypothetical protein
MFTPSGTLRTAILMRDIWFDSVPNSATPTGGADCTTKISIKVSIPDRRGRYALKFELISEEID